MAQREEPPAAVPTGRRPKRRDVLAIAAAVAAILAAVGTVVWQLLPAPRERVPVKAYYTVDDGATWFADDLERIPPFEHDGKPAVRLRMFTCDSGKTRFVGYLEKLPEHVLRKFVADGRDLKTVDDDELAAVEGWLAKRPGATDWISSKTDPKRYNQVINVTCPKGGSDPPTQVYPEYK